MERRNRLSDIARLAAWYDGVSDLDLHGPTIPSHLKHFVFNVQLIAGPHRPGPTEFVEPLSQRYRPRA